MIYPSLLIFIIAFLIRLLNIYFSNTDVNTYISEDQFLYWDWALQKAFTSQSTLPQNVLVERMPGSFLFFQFAIWLVGKNLFKVLIMQIIIDSFNCFIIASIAKILDRNFFLIAGLLAAISPLLVIVSSQVLSDTIFLLFFNCFIYFIIKFHQNNDSKYVFLAALFLSLSLFTRTIVLPLIILSLFILTFVYIKNKFNVINTIKMLSLFLIFSLILVLPRIINNYNNYGTVNLTNQNGYHFAHWVVPGVLDLGSEQSKAEYYEKLKKVSKKIETIENPFEKSSVLSKLAINTLLSTDKVNIILAWCKGAFLNVFAPSLLLDKKIRSLHHPSFYESERNVKLWLLKLFNEGKYKTYKNIFIFTLFSSVVFVILTSLGLFICLKNYTFSAIFSLFLVTYFLFITGPVFSPKYIHPIITIFIIFETLALLKIYGLIRKFFQQS